MIKFAIVALVFLAHAVTLFFAYTLAREAGERLDNGELGESLTNALISLAIVIMVFG